MQLDKLTPVMERVLKYAAIEAERDKAHIGTEQVLIGMILEGGHGDSDMLTDAAFRVESLRGKSKTTRQTNQEKNPLRDSVVLAMEFAECQICSQQPGTSQLCTSCVHNRDVVWRLKDEVRRLIS